MSEETLRFIEISLEYVFLLITLLGFSIALMTMGEAIATNRAVRQGRKNKILRRIALVHLIDDILRVICLSLALFIALNFFKLNNPTADALPENIGRRLAAIGIVFCVGTGSLLHLWSRWKIEEEDIPNGNNWPDSST